MIVLSYCFEDTTANDRLSIFRGKNAWPVNYCRALTSTGAVDGGISGPIVNKRLMLTSGRVLANVLRYARRKTGHLVPFERRAANLRRFDNDGEGPSPMRAVSLALPGEEEKD